MTQLLVKVSVVTVPAGGSTVVTHDLSSAGKAVAPTLILPDRITPLFVSAVSDTTYTVSNTTGAPLTAKFRAEYGYSPEVAPGATSTMFWQGGTVGGGVAAVGVAAPAVDTGTPTNPIIGVSYSADFTLTLGALSLVSPGGILAYPGASYSTFPGLIGNASSVIPLRPFGATTSLTLEVNSVNAAGAAHQLNLLGSENLGSGSGGPVYVRGGRSNTGAGGNTFVRGGQSVAGVGGSLSAGGGTGATDGGSGILSGGQGFTGNGGSAVVRGGTGAINHGIVYVGDLTTLQVELGAVAVSTFVRGQVYFDRAVYVGGTPGVAGQVFTSAGPGLPPTWAPGGAPTLNDKATLDYKAKTANYVLTANDYCINCTSGTFTVTLPPAATAGAGRVYVVKNSGTGSITVDGDGAETIDGAATYLIATQYASITLISTGTGWIII